MFLKWVCYFIKIAQLYLNCRAFGIIYMFNNSCNKSKFCILEIFKKMFKSCKNRKKNGLKCAIQVSHFRFFKVSKFRSMAGVDASIVVFFSRLDGRAV